MGKGNPNWVKGKSANPGGRVKPDLHVQALARKHCPEAIATLAAIMQNDDCDPKSRVAAANALLDRGYGKPAQAIEVSGEAIAPATIIITTPLTR